MSAIELSGWLAGGYSLVLLLVAYGIDLLARRAHAFNEEHQTSGFTYHEDHDAWLCPEDQWLWPQSFDPENRVMRYRGRPSVCNACPVKDSCTTTDDGRELGRAVDSWPSSESARFHRGIACAVAVLAVLFPVATILAVEQWTSQLLLLGVGLLVALGGLPLWSHLRRSPVDPEGVLFRSLDENLEERTAALETLQRRRTTYGSDRRADDGPGPTLAPVPLELGRTRYASDRREVREDA
ncbi:hypothetical protein [Ornithinimicrobium pekingense]|uniref:Transposase n=1 Tax=Ornithinimicrobium pekingense TaxID=384677 RepID=A0ABQ2FCE3_9MICO|nr:hypothetical protein [Ornithinimicrobium pekingense]GGK75192.1 hypothetical protein GCM10011509_24890 [Ornithinimicrobium pekingense]